MACRNAAPMSPLRTPSSSRPLHTLLRLPQWKQPSLLACCAASLVGHRPAAGHDHKLATKQVDWSSLAPRLQHGSQACCSDLGRSTKSGYSEVSSHPIANLSVQRCSVNEFVCPISYTHCLLNEGKHRTGLVRVGSLGNGVLLPVRCCSDTTQLSPKGAMQCQSLTSCTSASCSGRLVLRRAVLVIRQPCCTYVPCKALKRQNPRGRKCYGHSQSPSHPAEGEEEEVSQP